MLSLICIIGCFFLQELYEESGINSWKSAYDITLPPNLLEMCRPNKCDLCDVSFTKPIVGKTHYAGKSHVGNTEKYLGKKTLNQLVYIIMVLSYCYNSDIMYILSNTRALVNLFQPIGA